MCCVSDAWDGRVEVWAAPRVKRRETREETADGKRDGRDARIRTRNGAGMESSRTRKAKAGNVKVCRRKWWESSGQWSEVTRCCAVGHWSQTRSCSSSRDLEPTCAGRRPRALSPQPTCTAVPLRPCPLWQLWAPPVAIFQTALPEAQGGRLPAPPPNHSNLDPSVCKKLSSSTEHSLTQIPCSWLV